MLSWDVSVTAWMQHDLCRRRVQGACAAKHSLSNNWIQSPRRLIMYAKIHKYENVQNIECFWSHTFQMGLQYMVLKHTQSRSNWPEVGRARARSQVSICLVPNGHSCFLFLFHSLLKKIKTFMCAAWYLDIHTHGELITALKLTQAM